MAQSVQTQGPQPAQAKKRVRISKRARGWIIVCGISLLITIAAIIIFNKATAGSFPTVFGLKSTDFAVIFSNDLSIAGTVASIVSFIVTIYFSIHDNNQSKNDAGTQPISTGSSTTLFSGDSASENTVSGNALMTGSTFSGPTTIYMATPSPQLTTTSTSQPANTLSDTPSASTATNTSVRRPSGSLSFHNEPTVPTNPRTIQQREETVKRVYQELTQPEISSVVLTAIGGQGKSTLAALVFNYVESHRSSTSEPFQDASLWFDVGQDMLFSELASDILHTLGVLIPDFKTLLPRNQALKLFTALNTLEKPRLIVLNQFENLLDWGTGKATTASSGVDDFVDALNSNPCTCHVLLTSRPRPVGTRSQPASCFVEYEVDGLAIVEGMDLLRKQGVSIQQATDEDLQEAVRRCDGHAFALVLLAILLQNRSLTVKALLNNPNYNQKWGANIAHQLLDDIVKRLAPIQRDLLLAFSIYHEAVPIGAARAIMTTTYENEQEQIALDALYNQHLLQSPANPTQQDEPCYQLHAIVSEYAQKHFVVGNKQANGDALRNAHEKAAQYYIQMGQTICPEPDKRHQLEDVLPFVEAVRHYYDAGQWEQAYKLMSEESLFANLRLWGENVLLLELCELLLNKGWKPETRQVITIFINLGKVYSSLGDKQKAISYYEQALPLTQQAEKRASEGTILNDLGLVYYALGDKRKALAYYEQALQIWRQLKSQKSEGTTLNNLGSVYNALGDKQKALDYYEQALELQRAVGDRGGEGVTLNNLGSVYDDLGDKQKALDYYEQALELRRAVGDRGGVGQSLNNLGSVYNALGDKQKALDYYEQALELRRAVGDRGGEGTTLNNLGRVYDDLGDKQKALDYYEQALELRRAVGDRGGVGQTLWNIGVFYLGENKYELSLACLVLAKNLFIKVQSPKSNTVQGWIDDLRDEVGEQQFTQLLAQVEPRAQQIVDEALSHSLPDESD